MADAPADLYVDAIVESGTQVTRRVDVYEADGVTLWADSRGVIDGSVSVDQNRDERRTITCTLENLDGVLDHDPENFWYDKILKVYRGVETEVGSWETQLGEFMIDSIQAPHFPKIVDIQGRDYTKKLKGSKFSLSTTFTPGQALDGVIRAIAYNAGLTRIDIPPTGQVLDREFAFERSTERWQAIKDLATAYGYEVWFRPDGYFTMAEIQDPLTAPEAFTFETGRFGTMVQFTKTSNDSRLFNHIVVTGGAADTVPIFAEARNDDPLSPTRIDRIGDRVYPYHSEFITYYEQALNLAQKFLKVYALEEFQIDIESVVLPWLDAGEIIGFIDPDPGVGEPSRYLLSSFGVPLRLGSMSLTGKRLAIVG